MSGFARQTLCYGLREDCKEKGKVREKNKNKKTLLAFSYFFFLFFSRLTFLNFVSLDSLNYLKIIFFYKYINEVL